MKYDLIIVGGGPAGLMAAKTAAEDGLKVLLVERKKNITATPRTDSSIFYWKILPDDYIEPIMVEMGTGVQMQDPGEGSVDVKTRFKFLGPGFTFDYTGPVILHHNLIKLSPSGQRVYCIKDELWGFYYSRECLLADLLAAVQKTQAEIWTGTTAFRAENTTDGVRVQVRTKSGEQTLEAKRAIAADGIDSVIVNSLGLNRNRTALKLGSVGYILEGVVPDIYDQGPWFSFDIPSICPGLIYMGFWAEAGNMNLRLLVADTARDVERFMKESKYASWFSKARLVRKTGWACYWRSPMLKEPAVGNVLIISDAISAECLMQGAMACGYQGAKATLKELDGQKGYTEYTNWMHQALAYFAIPDHFMMKAPALALFHLTHPSDDDVDCIYRITNQRGVTAPPMGFILQNPELIKEELPEFYVRLKKAIERINVRAAKGGWHSPSQRK